MNFIPVTQKLNSDTVHNRLNPIYVLILKIGKKELCHQEEWTLLTAAVPRVLRFVIFLRYLFYTHDLWHPVIFASVGGMSYYTVVHCNLYKEL